MLAIIGGSGLAELPGLEITRRQIVRTPYGEPSGPRTFGRLGQADVVFLARHGYGHTLAPHEVKTIITRAGEGTKIVLTGDVRQIDQPYLDALSNGLSYLIHRMMGQPIYGHVTLEWW